MRKTDFDEKTVDLICTILDAAAERITTEASWARLEQFIYQQLIQETVLPSVTIVAWAEAGHPAAHRAIRRYGREMKERSRFDNMLVTIKAYVIKTDEQPFVPFPRGRHVVQHLMRDIWLPMVVQNVADGTGLPPTRGASTVEPSSAAYVVQALKRCGAKLKEQQLNRLYWNRHKLAARLEASMPPVPASAFPRTQPGAVLEPAALS
jgi:hypothetical protein